MEQKESYLEKLHCDILTIMDEVDRICRIHNIRYYLFFGSLIGAVRHKGFIPWDDDLDIVIERSEYNRLMKILPKEINDKFYLKWYNTEKKYYHTFAKVCLKNTLFMENQYDKGEPEGIFIDIFPLDYCNGYSRLLKIKHSIFKFLQGAIFCKGVTPSWNFIHWPRNIIGHYCSAKFIDKLINIVTGKFSNPSHFVLYPTVYPLKRQVFKIEWLGNGNDSNFEGHTYKIPTNASKILALNYGDNYMELPPVEKRKMHYPSKVIFSDGEVMTFGEKVTKVSYNDIIN